MSLRDHLATGSLAPTVWAGRAVLLLLVGSFGLRAPLGAQTLANASGPNIAVPRVGLTYMDLGSGEKATPALELTLADSAPLFWRAGLVAGLIASAKGAAYGYGGLQVPLPLFLGLVARPSVSVGLYSDGKGVDLGHALEFRSAFLVERSVSRRITVSAVLFHLSNGGLGRRNPGMEAVGVGVSFVPQGVIRSPLD
jgi:lipid A 3-O-deacylase